MCDSLCVLSLANVREAVRTISISLTKFRQAGVTGGVALLFDELIGDARTA